MKYLSLFSGIGGFEIGIQKAYVDMSHRGENRRVKDDQKKNAQTRSRLESPPRQETGTEIGWNRKLSDGDDDQGAPHCVGFSEIDKYATQIYQRHFPEHKNYGDIKKINEKELPDFDLLVGGFPCQPFSIAGLRRGFDDTRGTLFFEIARIVREKQPRLLLLENVKGLLSHDNGNTFYTIVSALDELGYDLQWQVLNSKNFGVPQNRERVFIVGHLRGTPRPEVFPLTSSDGNPAQGDSQGTGITTDTITARYASRNARGTHLKQVGTIGKDSEATRVYDTTGLARTIKNGGGMGAKTGLYMIDQNLNKMVSYRHGNKSKLDDGTLEGEEKLRAENAGMLSVQRNKENGDTPPKRGLARQSQGEPRRDLSELSHTPTQEKTKVQSGGMRQDSPQKRVLRETQSEIQEIRQPVDVQEKPAQPTYGIRRLTPLEAERLQGFPDGWTEGIRDSQRYKCLGNAVTTNVVYEIAKRLLA